MIIYELLCKNCDEYQLTEAISDGMRHDTIFQFEPQKCATSIVYSFINYHIPTVCLVQKPTLQCKEKKTDQFCNIPSFM